MKTFTQFRGLIGLVVLMLLLSNVGEHSSFTEWIHEEGGTGTTSAVSLLELGASSSSDALPSQDRNRVWATFTAVNTIHVLVSDDVGNVWAGTDSGVIKWDTRYGTYTKYTKADGLADNNVYAIAIERQDRLWFGTPRGVSEFNSGTWTTYTTDNSGLVDNDVRAMAVDRDGNKWFATWPEVSVLSRTGDWITYSLPEPCDRRQEICGSYEQGAIAFDGEGHIWFGTVYKVLRFNGSIWTAYDSIEDAVAQNYPAILGTTNTNTLWTVDRARGQIWTTEGGGASVFDGEMWITYTVDDGLASNAVEVIAIDQQGYKWFATWGGGTSRFDGTNWATYDADNSDLADNYVQALAIDRSDHKWFGTRTGQVSEFDETVWLTHAEARDLPINQVSAIGTDGEGHVWLGMLGGGVSKFDGAAWTTYNTVNSGLADNRIFTIATDGEGHMWFGTVNGVSEFDGQMWSTYTVENTRRRGDEVTRVTRATSTGAETVPVNLSGQAEADAAFSSGYVMFETDPMFYEYRGYDSDSSSIMIAPPLQQDIPAAARVYAVQLGLRSNWVHAVTIDGQGHKWFGFKDESGVSRFDGSRWTTYDSIQEAVAQNYSAILGTQNKNRLWAVNSRTGEVWTGNSKFDGSTWTTYTTADGLASEYVNAVAVDGQGYVWFGTDWGVSRFDGNSWTSYGQDDGVPDNDVYDIAIDGEQHVWIATEWGASEFDGSNWTTYQPGNSGLAENEVWTVVVGEEGDVWFGTYGGGAARFGFQGPGATCNEALPFDAGTSYTWQLANPNDVDWYSIDIPQAFSTMELTLSDPNDLLDLAVARECGDDIGSARHIGGELRFVFNVKGNPGIYYIRLSSHATSDDDPIPYRLHTSVIPPSQQEVRTLILTQEVELENRFDSDSVATLLDKLAELAAHPRVKGLPVDIERDTDDTVREAYNVWIENPKELPLTNALADALHDWIWEVREAYYPRLQYIVLVGDDQVIPFRRVWVRPYDGRIDPNWKREREDYYDRNYVPVDTTVGAALGRDRTLTDDIYGTARPLPWQADHGLYLPDIPVGRLVETPADIVESIDLFLQTGGGLTTTSSLAAGYDFMQDAALAVDEVLAGVGVAQRTRLIEEPWGANELALHLLDSGHELDLVAVHADHFTYGTPVEPMLVEAACQSQGEPSGALIYAVACHAGLSVPGGDCANGLAQPIGDTPQSLDWPQVWIGQGSTYVASTAWAYGGTTELAYLEELLTLFTEELVAGGSATVGEALVAAKRAYYREHPLDHWHEKTLIATTLFGLPMYQVRVEGTGAGMSSQEAQPVPSQTRVYAHPSTAQKVWHPHRIEDDPTLPAGLFRKRRIWDFPAMSEYVTDKGRYFTFGSERPRAEHAEPIQPRFRARLGLSVSGLDLKTHGAMFTGGTYQDLESFDPVIEQAGVLSAPRVGEEPPFEAPNWYPAIPGLFRRLERQAWTQSAPTGESEEASLVGYLGQYHSRRQAERLYNQIAFDIYYSESDDFEAPRIVSVEGDDASREVTVAVTGTVKVYRVAVTYTEDDGAWETLDLTREEGTGIWQGTLPTFNAVEYIVQAVDEAGNVAVDDKQGAYYVMPPVQQHILYLPLAVKNIGASPAVVANSSFPLRYRPLMTGEPGTPVVEPPSNRAVVRDVGFASPTATPPPCEWPSCVSNGVFEVRVFSDVAGECNRVREPWDDYWIPGAAITVDYADGHRITKVTGTQPAPLYFTGISMVDPDRLVFQVEYPPSFALGRPIPCPNSPTRKVTRPADLAYGWLRLDFRATIYRTPTPTPTNVSTSTPTPTPTATPDATALSAVP